MPPRRKCTITITKEIKGTISTEGIDDNVSRQNEPLGFAAAAAKHQGRKVASAISAKDKGVVVPKTEVSIRSSKQKAIHKILSMDKEDVGDFITEASKLKPSLGERENDSSGATAGAKRMNRKKQGPRAKKALTSIPEDVDMEADEVKEVSKLRADEVKPDKGKSRGARAKENDQNKLSTEQEEEQQRKEPQQEKMTTCHKTSRKRGGSSMLAPGHSTTLSPVQAPGNLLNKTTDSLSMPIEKLDPLSARMVCTQEPTKPESKDHALNVRSSTRAKKVVYYNEQSPRSDLNEKKVFTTAELKAQAITKRTASAAKLIQGGAKRVKEDPTSSAEELDSAKATSVKRGRRHQKLSSPQKLLDKKSVAFRRTGAKEECSEHQKESNIDQGNSSSAFFNSVDSDKALLLQTDQLENVKFSMVHNVEIIATSPAQEDAKLVLGTRLEKASNAGCVMYKKRESGHIAHNQLSEKGSLSEKSQDQMMAGESTSLEMLSTAAGKGVLQQPLKAIDKHSIPFNDRKKINASKGRKVNSKQRALPLESDESAKSKVSESPLVQGAANSMTDAEPEEMCGIHRSVDADKKLYCESQNGGRNTFTRKRTLQGTSQQAKKQKESDSNCLDTLPLTASLDMLVERVAPAQNQEDENVIQGVKSQGWNAVDITNSESRVERQLQKKRREEVRRKRAMRFDALPVGFGLGISCWSTPPWANQSTEEGVVEVVDSSVMGFQVQLKSPMEEATKQLCLQETAMSNDANNTSLGLEDTHHALPSSATETQAGSFSTSDAERLPGSGIKSTPKNDSNQRQGKAKVKRQVARKTKTSKALLLESPLAVHTGSDNSMLDKENLEPKLRVDNDESEFKMRRSSRKRIATAGKEKTTRTKKQ